LVQFLGGEWKEANVLLISFLLPPKLEDLKRREK